VVEAHHLDLGDGQAPTESSAPAPRPSTLPGTDDIRERWLQLTTQMEKNEALEKQLIEEALAACYGVVARTARLLDVPRTGLISRFRRLGIDYERYKERPG
jgi:transcriptional regulator with GAF, ATPase, and Fis domain